MLAAIRSRLTYSNTMATIAVFVALGGAAVAAGLPRNSVGTTQLKRRAVTAAKLAPKSVVAGKLGPRSVGPGNLGNGAVTTPKLAQASVIAATIKNGVVTANKLQNEAVTTGKLANGAVTTGKLGNGAVTTAKLGDEVAPLLGTLKSGQTLRGMFDVGGMEVARDGVSYQFPLLSAATATLLKPGETSANCGGLGGGNQQTPQATPGNLCVYVTEEVGSSLGMAIEHNSRLGFGLKTSGTGDVGISGQWAVTAP